MYSELTLSLLACAALISCQRLKPQTNTFNSTFALSEDQIAAAGISEDLANNIKIAVQFEQSNWATGSVKSDPFYTDLPSNSSHAAAGSVLKVEQFTNVKPYTIAPTLTLSRFIYQSKTLNGSLVPVSAFILWPYSPRHGRSVAPMVTWGHGTSGILPECAPSHERNLHYQFSGLFELALAGYAVVGSDYAGLGVPSYSDGSPIVHQFAASPAAGNDLLYAAKAAHSAFPDKLTQEFVAMGHSQGGGAAWGAAQQQLSAKIPGYLGAIAVSPVTDPVALSIRFGNSLGFLQAALGIQSIFANVSLSDMLTPRGLKAVQLLEAIQGCNSAYYNLVTGLLSMDVTEPLTKDQFLNSSTVKSWEKMVANGGKKFKGPLLVLQGLSDTTILPELTADAVQKTCQKCPESDLRFVAAAGVGHVPAMYATSQVWMDWLDERFDNVGDARAGRRGRKYCRNTDSCSFGSVGTNAPMPLEQYAGDLNYFLELALDPYEVA